MQRIISAGYLPDMLNIVRDILISFLKILQHYVRIMIMHWTAEPEVDSLLFSCYRILKIYMQPTSAAINCPMHSNRSRSAIQWHQQSKQIFLIFFLIW